MKKLIKYTFKKFGYILVKEKKRSFQKNGESNVLSLYFKLYDRRVVINKHFFNIGAGAFYHPAWTNVDFNSDWYNINKQKTESGIQFDLMSLQQLPIETNTAEVVYSSHTIEHITNEAAQNLFSESYRILKKGGYFRISAPDIDLSYRAYVENDRHFFSWIDNYSKDLEIKRINLAKPMDQASLPQIFLHHFATSVSTLITPESGAPKRISDEELKNLFSHRSVEDVLNYCVKLCPVEIQKKFPGNHINWWNKQKILSMLKVAGFKNTYISGYGQSCCPILRDIRYFDTTHPAISLYIEAKK